MIPQDEFQTEITDYMKHAGLGRHSAETIAALITKLAQVTKFDLDRRVLWPEERDRA
jgi:hypothetical protein